MIERHVTFDVIPEHCQRFEEFFVQQYRPAMASMPGFVRVELLREQENPHRFQMLIRFDSAESAAGWRNSEPHRQLQPSFKPLYAASELTVYEVVA